MTSRWPALPIAEWRETRDTLHRWLQMVGKVRMANTPLVNHWWNVPLFLTVHGLTTGLMDHPSGRTFQIDVDLTTHWLEVVAVAGGRRAIPLRSRPLREFYGELTTALDDLDVPTPIWPVPVEIPDAVPFLEDASHSTYEPGDATRFWRALIAMRPVFEQFRARFVGKASPVHLFWGGLDLATTRFSGRTAPAYAAAVPNCGPAVMLEAYSHEVSSCGYWPDGGAEGAFYSYAYPVPETLPDAAPRPAEAYWSDELGEFLLPYEVVRSAPDPDAVLMAFLQSTYDAVADAAAWDRAALERGDAGPVLDSGGRYRPLISR